MADKEGKEAVSEDKIVYSDKENDPNNANEENKPAEAVEKTDDTEGEKEINTKDVLDEKPVVRRQPIRIEMKTSQLHYSSHTKSTLPHILTEYGLVDANKNQSAQKPVHRPKRKRRDKFTEDTLDDRRPRSTKDKYSLLYDEANRANKYYAEYHDQLERKVERQRRDNRLREEEEERRKEEEREKERQLRHHPPRRLERHTLVSDDEFIRSLHKTDLARIVGLQDKLRKEGKLKCQADVDHFWDDIKKPEVFYAHFKTQKRSTDRKKEVLEEIRNLNPTNTPDSELTDKVSGSVFSRESSLKGSFHLRDLTDMPPRSLSHISERIEASRQGHRGEPWAVTQMFPHQHEEKVVEKPRPTSAQLAKQAALDLERRCPKLEMPPLACFNLDLGEKPPDPDEVRREIELKMRQKNRKKLQRKIRKMHQLAMANSAAANRILAKRGDLTQVLEGTTLRDLLAVWGYDEDEGESEVGEVEPAFMTQLPETSDLTGTQLPVAGAQLPVEQLSRTSTASGSSMSDSRPSSKKSSSRARRKNQLESPPVLPAIEYPPPPPLTMSEMERSAKVVEAKCLSTMWTNYAHAGRSVFAPS